MAEPFVFHFRRGDLGNPEQMYLADARVACGVCRHPQLQRFYHAERVHPLRLSGLHALALSVRDKTSYECPNCGSDVGPADVEATAVTWAFADDRGLIRGFVEDAREPKVRWQFVPGRRLDPQELPGWAPDPASPSYEELDDADVQQAFGRVFSVKVAIRELVADWLEDPEGGLIAHLSEDFVLLAAGPDVSLDELADEVGGEWLEVAFDDAVPSEISTHREPAEMAGRLDGWMPADVDRSQLRALVDMSAAADVIGRAFDVANLKYERTEEGFDSILTPREQPYPRPVRLLAVARRAVYTGLTPGDAARLTAEEIVGTLLRVW